jgi:hypothetical protein
LGLGISHFWAHYRYELTWCIIIVVLFLLLPLVLLLFLFFGKVITFTFTIGVGLILADGFLTKVGLKLKCSELNLSFMILKGRVKEDYMLILSRIGGILIFLGIMLMFNNEVILLIFVLPFTMCVVGNAIMLWAKISCESVSDSTID